MACSFTSPPASSRAGTWQTELLRKTVATRLLQGSQRWSLCRSFQKKKNRVRTGMGVTFGVPSFKVARKEIRKPQYETDNDLYSQG